MSWTDGDGERRDRHRPSRPAAPVDERAQARTDDAHGGERPDDEDGSIGLGDQKRAPVRPVRENRPMELADDDGGE